MDHPKQGEVVVEVVLVLRRQMDHSAAQLEVLMARQLVVVELRVC